MSFLDDIISNGGKPQPPAQPEPNSLTPAAEQSFSKDLGKALGSVKNFQTPEGVPDFFANEAGPIIAPGPNQPNDEALAKAGQPHGPGWGGLGTQGPPKEETPPEPKAPGKIGPFKDTYQAWKAAPSDLQNYSLQGTDATGYSWVPQAPGSKQVFSNGTGATPPTEDERRQFQQLLDNYSKHKYAPLSDLLGSYIANIGPAANYGIADLLGLPVDLAASALNANASRWGFEPITDPVGGSKSIRKLAGKIGIDAYPSTADHGMALTAKVGQFMPSFLPGESIIAGMARGADITKAPRMVREYMNNPMGHALREAEQAGMMGLGAGEAGLIYKSAFGDQATPTGQATAELVGGLALSPRIPVMGAAAKAGGMAVGGAFRKAKELAGFGPQAPAFQGMSLDEARSAVSDLLHQRMVQALDNADLNMAALGRRGQGPLYQNPGEMDEMAKAAVQRGMSLKDEITGAFEDIAVTEKKLWGSIDKSALRDFTSLKGLETQLRADFEQIHRLKPEAYPTRIGEMIQNDIKDFDTLGAGLDIHEYIQGMLLQEMRAARPNLELIQSLEKIDNALMLQLGKPEALIAQGKFWPSGKLKSYPLGEEERLLTPALAFSAEVAALRGNGAVREVAFGGDRWTQGASTLEKFVRTGTQGFDAMSKLMEVAQKRYGTDGPNAMGLMIKDAMRQKYIEQVAPNGYVSLSAHQRFMERYGPLMTHGELRDVREQFVQAATSEQNVSHLLGFGSVARQPTSWEQRLGKAELFLDAPAEVALKHSFIGGMSGNSFKATDNIIKQLQRDPTGEAFMGYKQMVAQRFMDETENGLRGGREWLRKNSGVIDAITQHDAGFKHRIGDAVNATSQAGILNKLANLGATLVGAKAGEGIAQGGMGSSLVMASAGAREMRNMIDKLSPLEKYRLTAAIIADENYYNQFMRAGAGKIPMPNGMLVTILGASNPNLYGPMEQKPEATE